MMRIVVHNTGVTVETAVVPTAVGAEVLVETLVVGVCGSDIHAAAGQHPFLQPPCLPRHEVVGIVRELGSDADGVLVGDRVTVEPTLPCGVCKMCVTDRRNLCESMRFFGCGYEQGGMADFFTIPSGRLHVIPEGLTDLQGALIEPLATPVHAVRTARNVIGKAVVIIGAGTIGLLTLAAARHAGAGRIFMTDVLASKRDRAERLGAEAVFDASDPSVVEAIRAELGESADVVFDCVAIQSTMNQAVALASKGGTIIVVGVPTCKIEIDLPKMQDHQIGVQGTATYLTEDYDTAIEIIESGAVRPEDFVTRMFPLVSRVVNDFLVVV
jgi:2-desacetyl-2-hydroxyethyl bacteriochlorophyllide A dehydrogenase